MTAEEAAKVVGFLLMAYPDSFRNKSDAELKAFITLWGEMFEDESVETVSNAVKSIIATDESQFMPTIGRVKQVIWKQTHPDIMTEQTAWTLVQKALQNGIYGSSEEFQKLPNDVQMAVGNAAQLREWAFIDTQTLNSVIASNFMRSFRAVQKDRAEREKLPSGLRQKIEAASDRCQKIEAPKEVLAMCQSVVGTC